MNKIIDCSKPLELTETLKYCLRQFWDTYFQIFFQNMMMKLTTLQHRLDKIEKTGSRYSEEFQGLLPILEHLRDTEMAIYESISELKSENLDLRQRIRKMEMEKNGIKFG